MQAPVWHCVSFDFDLERPLIMGVCNITPDSFSDGSMHATTKDALSFADELLEAGADIIDVGGESARPGAQEVDAPEELHRVLDTVNLLSSQGVPVSIDTRHVQVASVCLEAGACVLNDISGFRDPAMCALAKESEAGLVAMHMQGVPQTMQNDPHYDDAVCDIEHELEKMAFALRSAGVQSDRICLDVGIGFGKSLNHNLELIAATHRFAGLGYPLMAAVSRKGFIGELTSIHDPRLRDRASALCAAFMADQGARVIRTHDPASTREMLKRSKRAVVALGSNMGASSAYLDAAVQELRRHPDIWVGAVSAYVMSEPAYLEDQTPFTNAVAVLQTTLEPYELLRVLQEIEIEHGRVRTIANGPRTLDLDIVDYEGVVNNDEKLMLPHPLALERDFVVSPLLEILPSYVLANGSPVSHEGVRVGKLL